VYYETICTLIYLLQELQQKRVSFYFLVLLVQYMVSRVMPINENAAVKPAMSPYGNTKQIGEEIILM
jgi:UDP-glucose 4-epimerase